jgi:hypothetical protein
VLKKPKETWIKDNTAGKSFADIGGLWGTVNETVTHAAAGGARRLMMADIQEKANPLWDAFRQRCESKGVKNVEESVVDLCQPETPAILGKFDIVHCSGIIYHVPDPFGLIVNLRKITAKNMILTSMYVPDQISNEKGTIDLSGGQALFIPALTGNAKEIAAEHFNKLEINVGGINIAETFALVNPDLTIDTGPWWWLLTPTFLRSILQLCRFEVVEEGESWAGRSYTFICRAI